jgi:nucleotidyltransferase substrate binding protein (TIGR01987 family)
MTQSEPDIRWKQRFGNYQKAFAQLNEFIHQESLNKLEERGLIKAFEYTYELAWNTMKDFLEYQGEIDIPGFRDAIRKSFTRGVISDGDVWLDMLQARNRTSHTYNEETARDIIDSIHRDYFPVLEKYLNDMKRRLISDP